MNKIIAISGTHGSSKSTLAYRLCSKFKLNGKNVIVLDELARKCPFEINKGAGALTPVWLTCKQLIEEIELLNSYDYIVADRSILDAYCYNKVLSEYKPNHMDNYLLVIKEHIDTYYYKIYVPDMEAFNFHIYDGVRDLDKKFRLDVYNTILTTYKDLSIPYDIIKNTNEIYEDLGLK